MSAVQIDAYARIPLCVDQNGHRFTLPPAQSAAGGEILAVLDRLEAKQ